MAKKSIAEKTKLQVGLLQISSVLLVLLLTAYLLLPVAFPEIHRHRLAHKIFPENRISLGLDLKGGISLLLKVDSEQFYREYIRSTGDNLAQSLGTEALHFKVEYDQQDRIIFSPEQAQTDSSRSNSTAEIYKALDRKTTSGDFSLAQENDKVIVTLTAKFRETTLQKLIQQSMEIVRHRIDESGTREIDIQQQGEDMILIQVPGIYDPAGIKKLLGKTAKMTFHLVDSSVTMEQIKRGDIPFGIRMLPLYENEDEIEGEKAAGAGAENNRTAKSINPNFIRRLPVNIRPLMHGDSLIDAQAIIGEMGDHIVRFTLSESGARTFADISSIYKGKNIAIVLDDTIISAPRINEPILGGMGVISGNFTPESARELALLLRSGALPTELRVVEERSVGPTLGQASIDAGLKAVIVGCFAVIGMMLARYRTWGLLANLALVFNLGLIVAIISALDATLTMPGIAGIALTLGMAVDANVLIFERIREERRYNPKASLESCIETGYRSSFKTILDSNITTIAAAVVLYAFGSASVRGFAVTLTIGIISSMFTSITFTKVLWGAWFRLAKRQKALLSRKV